MLKDMIAGLKARLPEKSEAKPKPKAKDAAKPGAETEKKSDDEAKPEGETDPEAAESAAALARRLELEAEIAELVHEEAMRLARGPEGYLRQAYGDYIERPNLSLPDAGGARFGAIADIVHTAMQPRKQPMVYGDLDDATNAGIHKEAREASRTMRFDDEAMLKKRFGHLADSAHPVPAEDRLKRQWIHHMASQSAYQRITGKDAPGDIPVLAENGSRRIGLDRDAERGHATTAFGMAGLPDRTIGHRFRTSPGIDRLVLPKGAPQRQAWVHGLLRHEHASDRDGRMTNILGRAAMAPVGIAAGTASRSATGVQKGVKMVDRLNAFAQQQTMTEKERSSGISMK